ncbi:MAG: metallophosphoesterase family protein [Candidatus Woesearchaeota archaeon]
MSAERRYNLEEIISENDKNKLLALLKERKISAAQFDAIIDQLQNHDPAVKHYEHHWGQNHIKIALMSDLHIGSKFASKANINDAFKRSKDEGVEAIYIAGDITEGYNMRPGHSFECVLHGADDQIQGVVNTIPNIGKPIYFITGDHDYSHFKRQKIEVGKHIEELRSDMHYLGMFDAHIEFSKNTVLTLSHPAKGTAYAVSYHPQKMVEAFSGGEKPNILAIGHYHKIEYLFYRNIHVFQTGCLQKQTDWMRRMNISAHEGFWILDIYMKKNGEIDRIDMKMFPYYK